MNEAITLTKTAHLLMNKKILFWVLSVILAVFFAVFQRFTGPSYQVSGKIKINSEEIKYKLPRTCTTGKSDCFIKIQAGNGIPAVMFFKKHVPYEPYDFDFVEMERQDRFLISIIPDQPPAGKIEYYLEFYDKDRNSRRLPSKNIILRFKGHVSPFILIPHIFLMFAFMILSVRIFIGCFSGDFDLKKWTKINILILIFGGFIFGGLTQLHAFGKFWTGIPLGHDLTDNKTLVVFVFWIFALISLYKSKTPKQWIVLAFIFTLLAYFIPHSLLGT
ncbi:MAG: hypothetical protein HY746_10630 [Elusimicrobia bacterium]|nr:hypothetical protein [Elusimicrobiota bacterium]